METIGKIEWELNTFNFSTIKWQKWKKSVNLLKYTIQFSHFHLKPIDNETFFFITFSGSILNYSQLFLIFFPEHLNNTFQTTLSCTLVVAWSYYVDYQTTQTGTLTSKMELFVIIFDSLYSLTIVTKISILVVKVSSIRLSSQTFSLRRTGSKWVWSQFSL